VRPPAKQQHPIFLDEDPTFLTILADVAVSFDDIVEVVAPLTALKMVYALCDMSTARQKGREVTLWRLSPSGDLAQGAIDSRRIAAHLSANMPKGWHHVSQWATSYAMVEIQYPHRPPNGDPNSLLPFLRRGLEKAYPGISIVSITPQLRGTVFMMRYKAVVSTVSLPRARRIQFTNDYATQLHWSWFTDSTPAGSKFYNGWQFVKDMNDQLRKDKHQHPRNNHARNSAASPHPAAAAVASSPAAAPAATESAPPSAPAPAPEAAPPRASGSELPRASALQRPSPSPPRIRDPEVGFEVVEPRRRKYAPPPPRPLPAPPAAKQAPISAAARPPLSSF